MSLTPDHEVQREAVKLNEAIDPSTWKAIKLDLHLSKREFEIVQAVFHDMKDAAIALDLGMELGTLRTHVDRLYHKLNIHGRPGLILRIFDVYRDLQDRKPAPHTSAPHTSAPHTSAPHTSASPPAAAPPTPAPPPASSPVSSTPPTKPRSQ